MSRASTPLLLVVLALGMAACGGDDDENEPTTPAEQTESAGQSVEAPTEIVGGRSVLKLDRELERVLNAAQVELAPAGAAESVPGGIALPITTGELDIDTPSGVIEHSGGLEFSAFGASVRAQDLRIRPEDGVVTADVAGERIPLLTTELGRSEVVETSDTIVLPSEVSIGDQAVTALNDALGVEVFEGGLRLGRLTASAERP
jgi:hypothetical protein